MELKARVLTADEMFLAIEILEKSGIDVEEILKGLKKKDNKDRLTDLEYNTLKEKEKRNEKEEVKFLKAEEIRSGEGFALINNFLKKLLFKLPKIKTELYELLASVAGVKVEVIKKESWKDVSKLIKELFANQGFLDLLANTDD